MRLAFHKTKKNIKERILAKKPALTVVGEPPSNPGLTASQARPIRWSLMAYHHERLRDRRFRRPEMLLLACEQLDRAEACRAAIDRDGEVIRTKNGAREHPLLRSELGARAFVVRTLADSALTLNRSGPSVARPEPVNAYDANASEPGEATGASRPQAVAAFRIMERARLAMHLQGFGQCL